MPGGEGWVSVDTAVHVYGDSASWRLVPADSRVGTHVVLKLGDRVSVFVTGAAAMASVQEAVNEAADAFTGIPQRAAENVAPAPPAETGRAA
jgi:hypothetical protein